MTVVINIPRALREPEYIEELSRELEGDVSALIMEEAADEIERLRGALNDIRTTVQRHLDPKIWHMANSALTGRRS